MTAKIGPTVTLLAIAATAFCLADLVHEGLGHGGACLASGGRMLLLSTTYENCSIRSRLIDGAGPGAGLAMALVAWAWLRFAPPRSQNLRAFLCLLFAFTIFWNVGYMIYSGLLDRGDWKFVINGWRPAAAWRVGLVFFGFVFYLGAMRALGAAFARNFAISEGWRPQIFASIALATSIALAVAAGIFDPRGTGIILTDALPAALSSLGLVRVGVVLGRQRNSLRIATPTSPSWIALGLFSAIAFIAVLGPGLRF